MLPSLVGGCLCLGYLLTMRAVCFAHELMPHFRDQCNLYEKISSEGQRVVVVRLNNRQRGLDDTPLFVLLSLLARHSPSLVPLRSRLSTLPRSAWCFYLQASASKSFCLIDAVV